MKEPDSTIDVTELDAVECIEITGSFRVTHFEIQENAHIEMEGDDGIEESV